MTGFFVFNTVACYFRLGYVRVNDYSTGLENWPQQGARNMRKDSVIIRRNPSCHQTN